MKKILRSAASYIRSADCLLLAFWFTASCLSMLFLWGTYNSGFTLPGKLISQALSIGLGFLCAVTISRFDYNSMLKLWKLYLPVCVILTLLVFTPLGFGRGGNHAWLLFSIGGRSLTVQPVELLKISFITTFALHLDKARDHMNNLPHIFLLCLHGAAHVLLVWTQDDGSALIFLCIFLTMIFCAGINLKYILIGASAILAAAPVLWFYVMNDDQKMRFLVLFNPERDPDIAYQQMRSAIALGTGGLKGVGVFSGRHVTVPEVYNDFIFAFIGESSGFMGCIGVIALILAIAFKVLYNSGAAKDDTGRFICTGVFAMIIFQLFINLGMCLGLAPVVGVTLPLISAGGTSVLSLYLALGLVLSVYAHSSTALFYEK